MRTLTRLPGGRTPHSTGSSPEIDRWVRFTQRRFGVSKSLIIEVALAAFFGVAIPDSLAQDVVLKAKRRKYRRSKR